MSKELEALNKIQHDFGQLKGQELVSCYETIFNALKRLEAIDNANPSEALEILDDFKNGLINKEIGMVMFQQYWFFNQIEKVKQALLKLQEQDKKKATCWDIVVKKDVNIGLLKGTIKMVERGDTDWKYYNRIIMDERCDKKDCLTEEEFKFLKEMLE